MDEETGTYAWSKPRVFSEEERSEAKAANGTLTAEMASPWLEEGVMWSAGNATCLLHLGRPPHLGCSKMEAGGFFNLIDAAAPGVSKTFDEPTRCLPAEVWMGFWQRSGMKIPAYLNQDSPSDFNDEQLLRWIAVLVHVVRFKLSGNHQEVARDEVVGWAESQGWKGLGYSEASFNTVISKANKALAKQLQRKGFEIPTH